MIAIDKQQGLKMNFQTWFNTFLEEKALPSETWLIADEDGLVHHITSAVVIEAIYSASKYEQAQIKNTIVKIDFHNGNVLHFFKHLAKGLVNKYASA
jgi:hypothetical protein|tara:strand:- start:5494 stop:5784 length:291 start_codon:yes stop_codon:yes gene_type:complete